MVRVPMLVLVAGLLVAACGEESLAPWNEEAVAMLGPAGDRNFEVWLVDQSNSAGVAYGGGIHIWDGTAFPRGGGSPGASEFIDLGGATAALCQAQTGASPVRPHMLFFTTNNRHAVLSFVASGHVVVMDAATRAPIACLRTTPGAGGARQAHAAVPAVDGSYILVANQNGKLLERIDADFPSGTFAINPAATIDLTTCTTPSGTPCQAAGIRPDNAPICPIVDRSSNRAFVTLRGGGLLVVDPRATPMRVVADFNAAGVHGNGCGGMQVNGDMYINSGGGTAANLSEFDVYRFRIADFLSGRGGSPALVFSDDLAPAGRDSHGMAASRNQNWLWVGDRIGNVAEVFDTRTNAHAGTVNLVSGFSADPAPDLVDISPSGDLMFFSLRGPNPLSGDPHAATGSTPGMLVVRMDDGGRTGTVVGLAPISNIDAGGVQRADGHGIRVRQR